MCFVLTLAETLALTSLKLCVPDKPNPILPYCWHARCKSVPNQKADMKPSGALRMSVKDEQRHSLLLSDTAFKR